MKAVLLSGIREKTHLVLWYVINVIDCEHRGVQLRMHLSVCLCLGACVWVALSGRLLSDTLSAATPPLNTPTACHASCSCHASMLETLKISPHSAIRAADC